jgi:hypothetical protein
MNSDTLLNKFISEIYPFTKEEIVTYKDKIDFKSLSTNINIKWSYDLIRMFEDKWDWVSLDQNRSVFKRLTLGLLFPERISLIDCNCLYHLNFCENYYCTNNLKKFTNSASLFDEFPFVYIKIKRLVISKQIDSNMIRLFYDEKEDNPFDLIRFNFQYI